jgi:transcriptional regulator with XRE-family HTH domain
VRKRKQGRQRPITLTEQKHLQYSPKAVAGALHARRLALGLSAEELGRELNVNGTTIRNWESGAVPVVACRILSWLFADDQSTELWRERAMLAEAALKDVQRSMVEYRSSNGFARR